MRLREWGELVEERINQHRVNQNHGERNGDSGRPEANPPGARGATNEKVKQPHHKNPPQDIQCQAEGPVPHPESEIFAREAELALDQEAGIKVERPLERGDRGEKQRHKDQALDE